MFRILLLSTVFITPALADGYFPAPKDNRAAFATHTALQAVTGQIAATIEQQGYYAPGDGGWAEYDWNATSLATADGVFYILPTGQNAATPGRYILRIPAEGIHPEAAGAYCDYPVGGPSVHDDTTALNNLSNFISKSGSSTVSNGHGTIIQTPAKQTGCYVGSGNFNIQPGVELRGSGPSLGMADATLKFVPYIELNPSFSVNCVEAAKVSYSTIWRAGLIRTPANMEDVYNYQVNLITDSSVGYKMSGPDCQIEQSTVIGFNTPIQSLASRPVIVDTWVDGYNGIEMTSSGDSTLSRNIKGLPLWSWTLPGTRFNTYSATAIQGVGAASYIVGDILTVPGGTCTTQPTLRVATVDGGGQPLTYTIQDSGDCSVPPESWGATAATTNTGGSGGSGSGNVTVNSGSCATPPVIGVTVSGGAITAVTGVTTAGNCYITSGMPNYQTAVTGLSLSGAILNVTLGRNSIALTGGTGTGATATILVETKFMRPGKCFNLHDRADGNSIGFLECEGFGTSVYLSNVWNNKLWAIGGEGGTNDFDHQTVGIDLENCVAALNITDAISQTNYKDVTLNQQNPQQGGSCTGSNVPTPAGNIAIKGGRFDFANFFTNCAICTGPYSEGVIDNVIVSWNSAGNPAVLPVQIGANSGPWTFENIRFDQHQPSFFTQWISVDPSATPPVSSQFGWAGPGSAVLNGDMVFDQANEGGSHTAGASPLAADQWRTVNSFSPGISLQRISNDGPTQPVGFNANGFSAKVIANSTPVDPGAAQSSILVQQLEGPSMYSVGWGGTNGSPVTIQWCAKASVTGNYSGFVTTQAQTTSYVFSFNLPDTAWHCFAKVVPYPTIGGWSVASGVTFLYIGFDLAAGSNFQTTNTDVWQGSQFFEHTGDVHLTNNSSATLQISGVHLWPMPFQPKAYQYRKYEDELALLRRHFQKSLPAGTAVGQNKGTTGAAEVYDPIANSVAGQWIQFNPPMEVAPTMTFGSTSAATANCYNISGAADVGAASATDTSTSGFFLSCAAGTNVANARLGVHWWADAGK